MFYNYPLRLLGGGKEDRTPDPLLAKQVLSQLSYTPIALLLLFSIFRFFFPVSSKLNNVFLYFPTLPSH